MSKVDALTAELEAAKKEESFLAAKAKYRAGELDYKDYRKVKNDFHKSRVAYREAREAEAAPEGAVRPDTVSTKADLPKKGDA